MVSIFVLGVLGCGLAGFIGYKNAPEWIRKATVAAVEDSELSPEDKREVIRQIDRVAEEYRSGRMTLEELLGVVEDISESPLIGLIMAYAAAESYVEPSGLNDDEKKDAKLAFQRFARGVFEDEIDTQEKQEEIDKMLDYVSTKDFQGNRQFKNQVSDEDLRALVAECKRMADEADVPDEPFDLDVGAEVKRIVDEALEKNR